MIPILAAVICLAPSADTLKQTLVSSDFDKKIGFSIRLDTRLSSSDTGIKKKPADLENPRYATLTFGDKSFAVISDEPDGKPVRLFVDANRDGDLSGDMLTVKEEPHKGRIFYSGIAKLDIGESQPVSVNVVRCIKEPKLKDLLLYDTLFGYEVDLNLDGKAYKGYLTGAIGKDAPLILDLNGNGDYLDDYGDGIKLDTPFNYTGTTYVLSASANKFSIRKSAQRIAKSTPSSVREALAAQKAAQFKPTVEWMTDYQKALELSKQTGKPILADFTGTDWCSWCIKLKNEVFLTSEFEEWAKKNVILLELDYPRSKPQSDEIKAQNKKLQEQFKIRGFPTILFLGADEKVLGSYGYDNGGPSVWTKKADEMIKKKA